MPAATPAPCGTAACATQPTTGVRTQPSERKAIVRNRSALTGGGDAASFRRRRGGEPAEAAFGLADFSGGLGVALSSSGISESRSSRLLGEECPEEAESGDPLEARLVPSATAAPGWCERRRPARKDVSKRAGRLPVSVALGVQPPTVALIAERGDSSGSAARSGQACRLLRATRWGGTGAHRRAGERRR